MKHFKISAPIYSFNTTVEHDEREYEVEVFYKVCAGHKATSLTPAEPEVVEIVNVRGIDFEPDLYAWDRLEQEAADDALEMAEDDELGLVHSFRQIAPGVGL